MAQLNTTVVSLLTIASLCMVHAVSGQNATPPAGVASDPPKQMVLPVKLSLTTDKTVYKQLDTMRITLTLTNPTKQAVSVTFPSGQKFDLLLRKVGKSNTAPVVVWQWSRGMMFTQMVTSTSIAPGKSIQFSAAFPPENSSKPYLLETGTYEFEGLVSTGRDTVKPRATARITVK